MSSEYTITGGPYTLKELASKVKLPQVVLVTQGFYGATDKDTISGGQVMVAYYVKRVKGVTGIHNKQSFHIPLNSAMQFSPVPSEGVLRVYERVEDVIESESPPVVVATVNMTQDAHGQVLRPGSILFPSRSKKTLKRRGKSIRKSSKGEVATAEFTTTMGAKVNLPMDCAAGFSTQAKDVKLYLPELMAHLTLPVEVKCFAHQKSRHCKNMSSITLTETSEEASVTGGLTMEGDTISDEQLDLPLELPVQVACINLTKEELQEYLYSRVKSTYESVNHRLATNWKVIVNGDACDKAQQEFYSSVRTDMAQEVVTVDVPERIYDEVGFGTGYTQGGVYCPDITGTSKPAPPVPPHCKNDSKEEPYVELLRVDSDKTDTDSNAPAPPRPPKPRSDSDSSNGYAQPCSATTDINSEPTSPQNSLAAPQVPTPPPPPPVPLQKVAADISEEPTVDISEEPTALHNSMEAPQVPTPPPPSPLEKATTGDSEPSDPQNKPSASPTHPKVRTAPPPPLRKTGMAIYAEPLEPQNSASAPPTLQKVLVTAPLPPLRKTGTAIYEEPSEPQNSASGLPTLPKVLVAAAPLPPLRKTGTAIYEEPSEPQNSASGPPTLQKVLVAAPLPPLRKTGMAIYEELSEPQNSASVPPTHPKVCTPPPLPLRKTGMAIYEEPLEPQNGTRTPPATASKPTGLGKPTAAPRRVLPPLSAKDAKKAKRAPPLLHNKPKQPTVSPPLKKLPGKPEAIYEEIQPDTSPPTVNMPQVLDRPIQLPPATNPKPVLRKADTQPLQVLDRPTQLPPAPNPKPALRKADAQPVQMLDRPMQQPPAPNPKPALLKKADTQPQLSVSQTQAEGSNPGPGPVSEEDNITFLKTLSCNDIIRLLDAMELPQYIDCFMKEHIDGELLACMTDQELQEVGITSSLHRKRFIKVIVGKHSAELLLESGNPYSSIPSHP